MADFRSLTIQSGALSQIADADSILVGAGIKTNSGNLTITPAGTDVAFAAGKNLVMSGAGTFTTGTGAVTINGATTFAGVAVAASGAASFDLSGGTGLFKTPGGAVTIGPGAVTVSGAATLSAAGTALTVTNNASIGGTLAVTGAATVTGLLNADGGIDRSTAAALNIGATNATAITIGRTGQTVTFPGNVAITGAETVTGATTFNNNVTFGDAAADDVKFIGRIVNNGEANSASLPFRKEFTHRITVDKSTSAAGVTGGMLWVQAGEGSNALDPTSGGFGGEMRIEGGTGGTGVLGHFAGTAGDVVIKGGAGGPLGTSGAAAGKSGGHVLITGGPLTVGSTGTANGDVRIGQTQTNAVAIGASGVTTTVTGGLTQLTGAVSLTGNAASSFSTTVGALTLDAAAALNLGTTNATSVSVSKAGVTTTVNGALAVTQGTTLSAGLTQSGGAVSLSANAASSLTTSAGALTLTSAAAATWSTSAGALSLNGAGGLNLQTAGATRLAVADAALTIQAGVTLATTGTGNINIPNNASARFNIEGAAVSANVTAANLGTLTAGSASNADALHTHSGVSSSKVTFTATTDEALGITTGAPISFADAVGNARVRNGNATAAGVAANSFGIADNTTTGTGQAQTVMVSGERAIPTGVWVAEPVAADVGKKVYLSATAGKLTLTAPSTAGNVVLRMGFVTAGGIGTSKMAISVGEPITL
jgi:hypothetical protein